MAVDYLKMTVDTLATLPIEKQEEVYAFALFLKSISQQSTLKKQKRNGSLLNIAGLGKSGLGDMSLNHDKYL